MQLQRLAFKTQASPSGLAKVSPSTNINSGISKSCKSRGTFIKEATLLFGGRRF